MKSNLKRILLGIISLCYLIPPLAIRASAASDDLTAMGNQVFEIYLFFRNISIFLVILSLAYLGITILVSTFYGKSDMELDKLKKTALYMGLAVMVIIALPHVVGWAKDSVTATAWVPPSVEPFQEPDVQLNANVGNQSTASGNSIFSSDISFEMEYITPSGMMPFALATPSSTSTSPRPLIVWLHGRGERYVSSAAFMSAGLPKVLSSWDQYELDGFDAYVICPQITHDYNSGDWMQASAKNNLQKLLDWFISEYNVDTSHIILCGHSMGGQGALYIAHEMPTYFSRLAVLSGYPAGVNIGDIKIPTRGYVGTASAGESNDSINFMNSVFNPIFGLNNTFTLDSSHGDLPRKAFCLDENHDKQSDLIKWMFS